MRYRIWFSKLKDPKQSWHIQAENGIGMKAKQLEVFVPCIFPPAQHEANPQGWVEVVGTLTLENEKCVIR